jgi:hypothetical protein
MKPIEYGEVKEILEIANRKNVDNSYQDLMEKEETVLNTVNDVVRYYKDKDIKDVEFINQSISIILERFVEVWIAIINGIASASSLWDVLKVMSDKDHPIYIGITMVILALFLFLVESSSKWTQ